MQSCEPAKHDGDQTTPGPSSVGAVQCCRGAGDRGGDSEHDERATDAKPCGTPPGRSDDGLAREPRTVGRHAHTLLAEQAHNPDSMSAQSARWPLTPLPLQQANLEAIEKHAPRRVAGHSPSSCSRIPVGHVNAVAGPLPDQARLLRRCGPCTSCLPASAQLLRA